VKRLSFFTLKAWAQAARRDGIALYLAARDPRVPVRVKVFAALVAAYVLSPIDLIPDVIPVLGYLDEMLLVPLAVVLMTRWIDPGVMAELRMRAERLTERPISRGGALIVIAVWIAVAVLLMRMLYGIYRS
jgi:uncharacterized membrane protein YkvA (DUF1232 family)